MRFWIQVCACFTLFVLYLALPYAKTRGHFTPFFATPSGHIFDETHFYSPGPHRFQKWGLLSDDLDVFENRKQPGVYPLGPSFIIGGLAKLFGNFEFTWILLHGLLPALLWAIGYFVFEKQRSLAWILVLFGFGPKLVLLLSKSAFLEPPDLVRMPNPALSAVLLLVCVGLLNSCFKYEFRWKETTLLAICSGLLFELYPFYAIAWFGALFLVSLVTRKKELVLTTFGGLVVSAPALYRLIFFQPALRETSVLRQGFFSHDISWPGLIVVALSIYPLFHYAREKKWLAATAFALLASSGIASNLQVLSGVDIHYLLHYRMRLMQPIAILLAAAWIFQRLPRAKVPILAVLAILTLVREIKLSTNLYTAFESQKGEIAFLRELRNQLAEPTVIATTDIEMIARLPAISGHWSFVPSSYRTQVSDQEILRRYAATAKLEGQTLEEAVAYLKRGPVVPDCPWTEPIYFFLRRPTLTPELMNYMAKIWDETDIIGERKLDFVMRNEGGHWNLVPYQQVMVASALP